MPEPPYGVCHLLLGCFVHVKIKIKIKIKIKSIKTAISLQYNNNHNHADLDKSPGAEVIRRLRARMAPPAAWQVTRDAGGRITAQAAP